MSGLYVAIFASFIVEVCQGYCGSEECSLYDCCAGYQDYGYGPLVRCFDVGDYESNFHVIVNETNPRIELSLRFRPRNDSYTDAPMQDFTVMLYHPDNHCFDGRLPACKEMPVIEFGTESCTVQATIGCGNHTEEVFCDPNDQDQALKCQYHVKGRSFLSVGFDYDPTTGHLTFPCGQPGCKNAIACDFDPDKDGYANDFYVELKNKPGCVSALNFLGWPGILPLKVNATGVQ